MKLSFFGAAGEVTGSCFLLEHENTKILVDCGIFQCPRFCDIRSREPFPFDPRSISALFISHAHIDHTGRIPKLVKEGFKGKIYSTYPTKGLAELMLKDSVGVLSKEAAREKEEVIYSDEDVEKAMGFWEGKNYREEIKIGPFIVTQHDAGHILGSAMTMVSFRGEKGEEKKILFTGDLGNPTNPLLNGIENISSPDYLVTESTYGDREHENIKEKKLKLERLWEISDMLKNKQIPAVPIYLDSPLAIHATEIYQKYYSYLNKAYIDKESFSFFKIPSLHFSLTTDESKKINDVHPPKIIIAGSGMSTGGRILHHERRYLSDSKSTILFIGYHAPGSLGRRILDGADVVRIFGEDVAVRCRKEVIHGYSAHPDENVLFEFIRERSDRLKKFFPGRGEPKASLAMVQKIRDYLGFFGP